VTCVSSLDEIGRASTRSHAVRAVEPEAGGISSEFEDIFIQDGSSFALEEDPRAVFPGRFTTAEPATI